MRFVLRRWTSSFSYELTLLHLLLSRPGGANSTFVEQCTAWVGGPYRDQQEKYFRIARNNHLRAFERDQLGFHPQEVVQFVTFQQELRLAVIKP